MKLRFVVVSDWWIIGQGKYQTSRSTAGALQFLKSKLKGSTNDKAAMVVASVSGSERPVGTGTDGGVCGV